MSLRARKVEKLCQYLSFTAFYSWLIDKYPLDSIPKYLNLFLFPSLFTFLTKFVEPFSQIMFSIFVAEAPEICTKIIWLGACASKIINQRRLRHRRFKLLAMTSFVQTIYVDIYVECSVWNPCEQTSVFGPRPSLSSLFQRCANHASRQGNLDEVHPFISENKSTRRDFFLIRTR